MGFNKMSIFTLAEQYNQFQHAFGQGVEKDYVDIIARLFSPKFIKIANGNELARERSELLKQLSSVKEFAGNWSIKSHEIIPSLDNKKCTIKYSLQSEKAGQFFIIAILTATDGQIDKIDEVFYQEPH
jgi:hypothetical protein